ncbi:MAG: ABC transporter ATP-binding protein [Bifidobacteriaceae bacterium]|jgi:ABC-type dipeptide/oligopeptide/nickel transport system ATPase component|nr:ABC transporter ATP-binding protein [Bifidobacteriaceae bacterium]
MGNAVEVRGLRLDYVNGQRRVRALDGVDLTLERGRAVAIVGESGAGKSTLAAVIGRLEPRGAELVEGLVRVADLDVFALDPGARRRFRREHVGYVPQDPIAALDPTMRIGRQLALALKLHNLPASPECCGAMLAEVAMADPQRVARLYPLGLSGGMAQRVAIALALIGKPQVVIADEPTAALDASVREEVITLLFRKAREINAGILWLSHDLRAVTRWCDDVAVMRRGRVVEHGPAARVLTDPSHPYTRHLVDSDPARIKPGQKLEALRGPFSDESADEDPDPCVEEGGHP